MTLQVKAIPSIDRTMLAGRDEERANSKAANGYVKVKFDNITIREGFNLRQEFDDIEELADSIESEGLRVPISVDMLKDGTSVLVDGERRYRALIVLRGRSEELKNQYEYIPALLNPKDLSETDRVVAMLTTQSARPFSILEEAEGYIRLLNGYMGEPALTITEIARRTGKSVPFVEQRILLAGASPEEKQLIKDQKVKPTVVQTLMRHDSNPVTRVEKIKEANERGQRLKVKDVTNIPVAEMCDEIIDTLKIVLKGYDFTDQGELKNHLIGIDSKIKAIKQNIK